MLCNFFLNYLVTLQFYMFQKERKKSVGLHSLTYLNLVRYAECFGGDG